MLEEDRRARSMLELIRDAVDADVLIGLTLAVTVAGLVRGFSGAG